MHDVQVDIVTNLICPDTRPDGIHLFKVSKDIDLETLSALLWGTAHLSIPFFAQGHIAHFVLYRAGYRPIALDRPHDIMDNPELCHYLGRAHCPQYADAYQ